MQHENDNIVRQRYKRIGQFRLGIGNLFTTILMSIAYKRPAAEDQGEDEHLHKLIQYGIPDTVLRVRRRRIIKEYYPAITAITGILCTPR